MTEFAVGPVAVSVPATSANLGPGFDSLAICLDLVDLVTAEITPAGTDIVVTGEGWDALPGDDSHLVAATMRHAFDVWQVTQPGIRLVCRNAIPQGRGLGSSAAAIVAGLRLAAALVPEHPFVDEDLLPLAATLDGHADNVAACLLGGLAIAWTDRDVPAAIRLDVDPGVVPVVFCADQPMSTTLARGLLDGTVTHGDAAANSAHAALLAIALTSRPDLLLPATVDRLHQEARRSSMPGSMALVDTLRAVDVPAVISGAGPSVLALCNREQAARVDRWTLPGWRLLRLAVEPRGARLVTL